MAVATVPAADPFEREFSSSRRLVEAARVERYTMQWQRDQLRNDLASLEDEIAAISAELGFSSATRPVEFKSVPASRFMEGELFDDDFSSTSEDEWFARVPVHKDRKLPSSALHGKANGSPIVLVAGAPRVKEKEPEFSPSPATNAPRTPAVTAATPSLPAATPAAATTATNGARNGDVSGLESPRGLPRHVVEGATTTANESGNNSLNTSASDNFSPDATPQAMRRREAATSSTGNLTVNASAPINKAPLLEPPKVVPRVRRSSFNKGERNFILGSQGTDMAPLPETPSSDARPPPFPTTAEESPAEEEMATIEVTRMEKSRPPPVIVDGNVSGNVSAMEGGGASAMGGVSGVSRSPSAHSDLANNSDNQHEGARVDSDKENVGRRGNAADSVAPTPGALDYNDPTRLLRIGVTKFNAKPKEGIKYLESKGILEHKAEVHAQFLLTTDGIKKTPLGEYITEPAEFNQAVFQEILKRQQFDDNILPCLRRVLKIFRLPGEAQKIDRVVNSFSAMYFAAHPGQFQSADFLYILCFAIIMLNTDHYKKEIKHKMTLEQFITTLRGTDGGKNPDPGFLTEIYNSICSEEITMDFDETQNTFTNPVKNGWLKKQGGRFQSWHKRWFVLTGNCLYYFAKQDDPEMKGLVPLENLAVRRLPDGPKKFSFELYNPVEGGTVKAAKKDGNTMVEGHHVSLVMAAESEHDMEEWLDILSKNIAANPFQEMVMRRRGLLPEARVTRGSESAAATSPRSPRVGTPKDKEDSAFSFDDVQPSTSTGKGKKDRNNKR